MKSDAETRWAWLSVVACAVTFFVTGGISRSFSLLYQEYMLVFPNTSGLQTATVAALFGAVKLCSSPLVSTLCNRLSLRSVSFAGGCIAITGTFLSSFAISLPYIYFTHGIVTAVGTNMIVTPSFILIGRNFQTRRAGAMSFMTMGACLGGIAYPPAVGRLLEYCGYAVTMRYIAASTLLYLIASCGYIELRKRIAPNGIVEEALDPIAQRTATTCDLSRNTSLYKPDRALENAESLEEVCEDTSNGVALRDNENVVEIRNTPKAITDIENQNQIKTTDTVADETKTPKDCMGLCNADLMRNVDFLVFLSLMMTSFLSMSVSNTFLVRIAVENSINPLQVASILSISSAINIPSRIVTGFVFDSIPSYRSVVFACVAISCGVWGILIPFATNSTSLSICCIAHCFFGSSLHSQHITILSDLVETRYTTKAIGMCRLFQGFGLIIGPLLGGALADYQQSHKSIFYASGSIFAFNSLLYLFYFSTKLLNSQK